MIAAIEDYVAHHNERARPFVWTAKAADILERMLRAQKTLEDRPRLAGCDHYTRVTFLPHHQMNGNEISVLTMGAAIALAVGNHVATTPVGKIRYPPCSEAARFRLLSTLVRGQTMLRMFHLAKKGLKLRASGCAFVLGALAPARADAHFVLQAPACYSQQDSLGAPEKSGPCGQADPATPFVASGQVTTFQSGQTITVTINEVVTHPGHYRVALAADMMSLPADPAVTAGATPCGSAAIEASPTVPVLADGVLQHTAAFAGPQSFQVTLPAGFTCTSCVLQVIEFMSSHGLNNPGGCFYHHCADVSIVARDGGSGVGKPDASIVMDAASSPADAVATDSSGRSQDDGAGNVDMPDVLAAGSSSGVVSSSSSSGGGSSSGSGSGASSGTVTTLPTAGEAGSASVGGSEADGASPSGEQPMSGGGGGGCIVASGGATSGAVLLFGAVFAVVGLGRRGARRRT
jgi:Lytic polysaccharide mono-oxygenase, cellulose-degrading